MGDFNYKNLWAKVGTAKDEDPLANLSRPTNETKIAQPINKIDQGSIKVPTKNESRVKLIAKCDQAMENNDIAHQDVVQRYDQNIQITEWYSSSGCFHSKWSKYSRWS